MAWCEAATVYDLRVMVDRVNPYQADPLPMRGVLGQVELVREAATLLMLLTIGALAGRTWQVRMGYTVLAFGHLGRFLLCVSQSDLWLADISLRLGHPIPATTALVGARARACLHRVSDDRGGHTRQPMHRQEPLRLGHVDPVELDRPWRRIGTLRVHG